MAHPSSPLKQILVYGSGLAAELTTIALAASVGQTAKIIRVVPPNLPQDDVLFGGIAPPSTYEFLRTLGVTEPRLLLGSDTSFSFGTQFENWPAGQKSWVQSFQQPLAPLFGVPFHQYLIARDEPLAPYLIAAQAAQTGAFAHPPEDRRHPLSRAEYGYHFDPAHLTALLANHPAHQVTERINGTLRQVQTSGETITALTLGDGRDVSADLYIDCSGLDRAMIGAVPVAFLDEAQVRVTATASPGAPPPAPCRTITARPDGWTAVTPLLNGAQSLSVSLADAPTDPSGPNDGTALDVKIGRLEQSWVGNCVALGHAATVAEPLSPAPMMLLERAIKRLLELIPHTDMMQVERREFNRRFENDADNAALFHRSLFTADDVPDQPYWREKYTSSTPAALDRKLSQYASRGVLVQYDHEPFNPEDWLVQHQGMGRTAKRHDVLVHRTPAAEVDQALGALRDAVKTTVQAMPPHPAYMAKFRDYLVRKHHDQS